MFKLYRHELYSTIVHMLYDISLERSYTFKQETFMQRNVIKTMDWQKLFYLNLGLRKLLNADKLLDICMKNICGTMKTFII